MTDRFEENISATDFAELFGTKADEVTALCGEDLAGSDFSYRICTPEEREEIFLRILKGLERKQFSESGPHRLNEWKQGWSEILDQFEHSDGDLRILIPKDIRGGRPLRLLGKYVFARSDTFEYDFRIAFKSWLYNKYFSPYENIYEFGCGTGHNLVKLARMYPDKQLLGLDWVPESQRIIDIIKEKYGWNISGMQFDLYNPNEKLEIMTNSLVYTSASLEQLGENHDRFLEYLLIQKPAMCINVEPISEFYDSEQLFDYMALKYHQSRRYLSGYLSRLKQLESKGIVEIIDDKRIKFGSHYHDAYSFIAWKPL